MLKEIHEHVMGELQQSARTDTVFVVAAVLFNLVVLGINWGVATVAEGRERAAQNDVILVLMIIATLLVNWFALKALLSGKETRGKLLAGMIAMYRDNGVDKYYDASLLDTYQGRDRLFVGVLAIIACVAIVVPLIERVMG
jgi:hypothetical protein